MACRDVEKAYKAAEDILLEVENANIVVMKLDLSSFTSVRQFAAKVREQE